MIFVTVGTHEQPFDRLVEHIDKLRGNGTIQEEVFVQTGFCAYMPQFCEWKKLISYQEMQQRVMDARIVITHGGPASFMLPLQYGKVPVVVPRKHEYYEHVNNHQVEFVQAVAARMGNIIPVYEMEQLTDVVLRYDEIVASTAAHMKSNNAAFNVGLSKIVAELGIF